LNSYLVSLMNVQILEVYAKTISFNVKHILIQIQVLSEEEEPNYFLLTFSDLLTTFLLLVVAEG